VVRRLAGEAARSLGCGDAGLGSRRKRSGVAGAGCKSIVGQRLRQAGMHQTTGAAGVIIALRCAEAGSQRDAICGPARSDANRLTGPGPKMILVTCRKGARSLV
jgi:hypothetical protein